MRQVLKTIQQEFEIDQGDGDAKIIAGKVQNLLIIN